MQILRHETVDEVVIGPFVDKVDGHTVETALSLGPNDIFVVKQDGSGDVKSEQTNVLHMEEGFYRVNLDANDTDQVGKLTLIVRLTGARNLRHEFMVMDKSRYDVLYGEASQLRVKYPAPIKNRLDLSSTNDGTYKATRKVRLRPGAVDESVSVNMKPVFGDVYVDSVGTPTLADLSSVTGAALGPRDWEALVYLGGTATAGDSGTVEFQVTMDSGDSQLVTFDVEVFSD